jgi:hypothetical protein
VQRSPTIWSLALPKKTIIPKTLFFSIVVVASLQVACSTLPATATAPSRQQIEHSLDVEVGGRLCLPEGTPWPDSPRTIVIISSATCPVCRTDAPAEDLLYARSVENGVGVLYVVPARSDQAQKVRELEAMGRSVIKVDLADFGVTRVPTVLAVDKAGMILSMWSGNLPSGSAASPLINDLLAGATERLYSRTDRERLRHAALEANRYQLLAFREGLPEPFKGARQTVIPFNEISVRAQYELRPDVPTYVDCSGGIPAARCQDTLISLAKLHFQQVTAIDLQQRLSSSTCVKGAHPGVEEATR